MPPKKSATTATKTPAKKKAVVPKKVAEKATDNTKIMGLLHIIGALLGTWWWFAVLIYYFVKKEEFNQKDKQTFLNIMNFTISFALYTLVASVLMIVIIGFVLLPIVLVAWFIIMIVMSIHHMRDESYQPPFVIAFLKNI